MTFHCNYEVETFSGGGRVIGFWIELWEKDSMCILNKINFIIFAK